MWLLHLETFTLQKLLTSEQFVIVLTFLGPKFFTLHCNTALCPILLVTLVGV